LSRLAFPQPKKLKKMGLKWDKNFSHKNQQISWEFQWLKSGSLKE
jgi:hypothetical protein